ncbi:hypothetical protein BDV18DRAFT_162500 [Aspergillus unguis]
MARGMLGKSHASPQAQGISKPYLRYTDALPRNDLQDISHGISYSRPIHQAVKGEQKPGTSEQHNVKTVESPAPHFDFRVTSPAEDSKTHLGVDESMIGIALGSPRLLQTHNAASGLQRIPPPTPPDERPSPALQRKSSKWRKIGGLFKAKNAIASPANKPFYQVRPANDGPQQDSTHSVDYRSRGRTNQSGPIETTEVWPCLASENGALERQQNKPKVPGSFLQVEIPPVEMERYSVMFGSLLNNNRPSLLDRRSKTLDNLTIPDKEEPLNPPQRRATSPAPSRSPSFKLFPTMPASKAAKVLGTNNLPRAPDPLRRSQGSTDFQSPTRPSSQATLTPDFRSKTQSSHRPHASVTSFLSATTISSDDEPFLINKIEPIRTFAGIKKPNWKVIHNTQTQTPNGTADPQTSPTKELNMERNLTINTRELGSDSNSISSTESSSPILSPLSTTTAGSFVFPPRNESITFCPPPRTSSRMGTPVQQLQPNHQPHDAEQPSQQEKPDRRIPSIEVSVARSVSVSRGKKQVIVPVRARAGVHTQNGNSSNERLVARQAKTPQVTGPAIGHRPHLSQDVRIEMV